jgi:hypothetical protein
MRLMWLALVVAAAGCFSPRYQDGEIQCSITAAHSCPDGYHCALNHTCFKNGTEPPPQHSSHVVFGAGGGIIPPNGGLHGADTSFGQPAGIARGDNLHSVQLGVLGGTATH